MKRFRILIVLVLVLSLVFGSIAIAESCTGIIVVGNVSADGKTRMGQTWDIGPMPLVFGLRITVDEETGIRVIWDARTRKVPRMNNYGVCHTQNYRTDCKAMTEDPDNLKTLYGDTGDVILSKAKTAKEAIDMAIVIADRDGVRSQCGGAKVYADKDEVYMIEGGDIGSYAISHYTNIALAQSNTIINPAWKDHEAFLCGMTRMLAAQEYLDQFVRANEPYGKSGGQISSPIIMKAFRLHEGGFSRLYQGNGWLKGTVASLGHQGGTEFASFGEIDKKYTNTLSIFWTTPFYPVFTPFIPFFVGIEKIPPSFAVGEENKTHVFVELINAIRYNMDLADEVQEFWESFENQTLCEIWHLRQDVISLLKDGDEKGAEEMLYDFVNDKCELAVEYAQGLTKAVNAHGLIKVKVAPFKMLLEPGRDRK